MKHALLFIFLLFSSSQLSYAQCSESDEVRVLLIGDSWAFFMGVDGTLNNVFEQWGHSNKKHTTSIDVAVNGARTTDFLEPGMQDDIQVIIDANPAIDVVHLSIGGNDVLGQWDVNFTQAQLDDLIDEVYGQTLDIITFLKSTRPGMKIVFSGYVYPNFEEVIETAAPLQSSHPFYGTWSGMGFPSFLQINTILNDFSLLVESYANTDPQVEFFKATSLMQYTFGQTSPLGVAPGGTYPPFTQALPFGDPSYPSPQNSMRDYFGITKDCFHLSPKGYRDLIGYHTQKFYQKFFMDDQYLVGNLGNLGNVSSLNVASADLLLGVSNGEEFGTVLDFETQNMDWGVVEKAELFLRIKELTGTNPLNSPLEISIKSGNIGSSAVVEGSDWSAAVDASETPCVFGKKDGPGDWIRIALPASFLPYVNKQDHTQFIIKSTGSTDGIVRFESAQDIEFAPVLNLKFDSSQVSIKEVQEAFSVAIYPNPGKGFVSISSDVHIESIKVLDVLGRLCLASENNQADIYDFSTLSNGVYSIVMLAGEQQVVKSFVKN